MKAKIFNSIGLSSGGEPPRAVPIRNGTGCNLWIGELDGALCITAHSAAEFRELAAAATEAATIQELADRRKFLPHVYRVSSSVAGITPPPAGWTCELCDELKEHEMHNVEAAIAEVMVPR